MRARDERVFSSDGQMRAITKGFLSLCRVGADTRHAAHVRRRMTGMDDNATRQRRKRKHAAGDHSECSTARCQSARAALHSVRSALDDDSAEAGASVLDAMLALIDSTVPDGHRAGEVMARIGMRLANDFDEGELSPGLLAELRTITRWLTQLSPSADESKLDALRARRAQRRVEAWLNGTFSAS